MQAVGARKVLGGQLIWPLSHHTDSPSLAAAQWGACLLPAELGRRSQKDQASLLWSLHGSIRAARDRPAGLGPGGRKA